MTSDIQSLEANASLGLSKVVRAGNLLFVSAQLALDEQGAIVGEGDPVAQADHAISNLRALLDRHGSGLGHVARITLFATSADYYPAVRSARLKAFGEVGHYPASTFLQVSGLGIPGLLVGVDAIAVIPQGAR